MFSTHLEEGAGPSPRIHTRGRRCEGGGGGGVGLGPRIHTRGRRCNHSSSPLVHAGKAVLSISHARVSALKESEFHSIQLPSHNRAPDLSVTATRVWGFWRPHALQHSAVHLLLPFHHPRASSCNSSSVPHLLPSLALAEPILPPCCNFLFPVVVNIACRFPALNTGFLFESILIQSEASSIRAGISSE